MSVLPVAVDDEEETTTMTGQDTAHIDKYFVFEMNGRGMNEQMVYVFKSSVGMAALAVEMDRTG